CSSMTHASPKVVLIFEAEPHLLDLLGDYLSGEGYQELDGENSTKDSEFLGIRPPFDLLTPGSRRPGSVSGAMIVEPAPTLRPDLKVLFISGYPIEIYESGSAIARTAPVLAKPFSLESLHKQVQLLLAD